MLWRLPLSCRSTWTPLVVTMGEDRGNKIMRGRNVRGAIIAVFLLGVLVFASVYYAWTTVIDIFQPVSPLGAGRTIPIVIRKGETTAQIADDLQAKSYRSEEHTSELQSPID